MSKCDKCGADTCEFCGKHCEGTCLEAKVKRLEKEVEDLKSRPPAYAPYVLPYELLKWVQPNPWWWTTTGTNTSTITWTVGDMSVTETTNG